MKLNQKKILEFYKKEIEIIEPSLFDEEYYICGPLITTLFLKYYFKANIEVVNECFFINYKSKMNEAQDRGYYSLLNTEVFEDNSLLFNFSIDGKNFDTKNRKENRKRFLEDWFCNLEQVAISFKEDKVVFTDEFEKFLTDRVISYGNSYTRKKGPELFSWENFLKENSFDYRMDKERVISNLYAMSKKGFSIDKNFYWDVYSDFYAKNLKKEDLLPYIYITKYDSEKASEIQFFEDGRIRIVDIKSNENKLFLHANRGLYGDSLFLKMLDFMQDKGKLFYDKKWKNEEHFKYLFVDLLNNSKGIVQKNRIEAVRLGVYHLGVLIHDEDFNREVSQKKIEKARKIIDQVKSGRHDGVIAKIEELTYLVDFYFIIEFLNAFDKNYNKSFLGFLENYSLEDIELCDSGKELFDRIDKEYWDLKSQNKKELVVPVDIKNFIGGKYVRELTSDMDLEIEGENLNHCVGGYGVIVKSGKSRIFNIKYKSKHQSTLEIRMSGGRVVINQHKSYHNTNPHPCNRVIADRLVKYLNENKDKVNFFKEKSKLKRTPDGRVIEDLDEFLRIINEGGERGAANYDLNRDGRNILDLINDIFLNDD